MELVSPPGVWIKRARSAAGRTSLDWGVLGEALRTYETTTKAQLALEERIGTWDVWRRTQVFSSTDAAHFSGATDKERKLLLESAMGLTRYDAASTACREELRKVERDHTVAASNLVQLRAVEESVKVHQATLPPATIGPSKTGAELRAAAEKFEKYAAASHADMMEALAGLNAAGAEIAGKEALAKSAAKRLEALKGQGQCPACAQTVTPAALAGLVADVEAARAAADKVIAAVQARQKEHGDACDEAESEERELRKKANAARVAAASADAAARAEVLRAKQAAQSDARLVNARKDVAVGEVVLAKLVKRLAVLNEVDKVLGFRGVRAHVLGRALEGIQQAAGAWLARLSGDAAMKITISAYSEKKAGGLSDAISVRISRAGGSEHSYGAKSGGERRLVDISILFALAGAAADAAGQPPGLLICDEVFDALDAKWSASVAAALEEIGQQQPLLVITHSDQLANAVQTAARWHVEGGKLTR